MAARFPTWVWVCAWLLAFTAGVMNVVTLLSFERQAVTHLTGTTTLIAATLASADWSRLQHLLAVLGSFLLGAMASGMLVQESTLRLDRRYGVVLALESLTLVFATRLLEIADPLGIYLTGFACGMQNAMVTAYSGTVIRTSHVTGMYTDIGIFLGHLVRGASLDWPRFKASLLIISGFICGGVIGALLFSGLGYTTLLLAAAIALGLAMTHLLTTLRKT